MAELEMMVKRPVAVSPATHPRVCRAQKRPQSRFPSLARFAR
jgi:hypothetical protein